MSDGLAATLAVLGAIVAVFLIVVVLTPLTIGFGWYTGEANLRSFSHVRATYQEAYDDVNSLNALAATICVSKQAVKDAKDSGDQNSIDQRQSQLLAYEGNFNRVRGEYQSYMTDHFRGKLYHPKDLPLPYPTLNEKLAATC